MSKDWTDFTTSRGYLKIDVIMLISVCQSCNCFITVLIKIISQHVKEERLKTSALSIASTNNYPMLIKTSTFNSIIQYSHFLYKIRIMSIVMSINFFAINMFCFKNTSLMIVHLPK
jgi:hypothetical protein